MRAFALLIFSLALCVRAEVRCVRSHVICVNTKNLRHNIILGEPHPNASAIWEAVDGLPPVDITLNYPSDLCPTVCLIDDASRVPHRIYIGAGTTIYTIYPDRRWVIVGPLPSAPSDIDREWRERRERQKTQGLTRWMLGGVFWS